jgi:hypothetical protein
LALSAVASLLVLLLAGCDDGATPTSAVTQPAPRPIHLPAPQPGSKVAAPGVPISKGGDNSIQTFGLEASSKKRTQLTAIVRAYLNARAAEDWKKACFHLAIRQQQMFVRLATASLHLPRPSCAAAQAALVPPNATHALAIEARIEAILSMRVGNDHAFLIYRRYRDQVYATALRFERGEWKVLSVAPTTVE